MRVLPHMQAQLPYRLQAAPSSSQGTRLLLPQTVPSLRPMVGLLLLVSFLREQVKAQSLIWSQAVTWSYKAFYFKLCAGVHSHHHNNGRIYVALIGYQALSILSLTKFKATSEELFLAFCGRENRDSEIL